MMRLFKNVVEHRTLLLELTLNNIKARYRETVLGMVWVVAQPVALAGLCVAAFSRVWGKDIAGSYPLFVYASMVVWTLFATAVSNGVSSLTQNSHLIKKIYFPREILVLAAVVPPLVDFLVSFLLLMMVLFYFGGGLHRAMWLLPVLLAAQMALVIGISLVGSMLNVIFRDVSRALPIVLAAFMFLSPVLYSYDADNGGHRILYWLNPFGGIIEGFRRVLLDRGVPDPYMLLIPLLMSLVFLVSGYHLFKRGESIMADVL